MIVEPLRVLALAAVFCPIITAKRGGTPTARLTYKRLLTEWKDIVETGLTFEGNSTGGAEYLALGPCRGNLQNWHFTFRGPPSSVFGDGLYHGRILLPTDYPASAPRLHMLTPNGRFEVGTDICLSATAYHQDTWSPSWTLRTLVTALRGHMLTKAVEIGGIEEPPKRRLQLARRSLSWKCSTCGIDHSQIRAEGLPIVAEKARRPGHEKSERSVDWSQKGVAGRGGGQGEIESGQQMILNRLKAWGCLLAMLLAWLIHFVR